MTQAGWIWIDGNLVEWDNAKIHVMSHSLHYGDAVFEGIRFYKTEKGPAVFRIAEHIKRLFYSASVFSMKVPYTSQQIATAIKETIKKNKIEEGYIRPILFFGQKMGLSNIDLDVHLAIIAIPWGSYLGDKAVRVKTSSFIRIHPKTSDMDAKISGHYVNSILASVEAKKQGYDEALLLDYKGNVAEGPGENIFIVKEGVLYTPKTGSILPGITRDCIIKIASDKGLKVIEKDLKLEDIYNAEEAFFTGTAAEVTPIAEVDGNKIGKSENFPITEMLKEEYMNAVRGKNKKYENWLEFV